MSGCSLAGQEAQSSSPCVASRQSCYASTYVIDAGERIEAEEKRREVGIVWSRKHMGDELAELVELVDDMWDLVVVTQRRLIAVVANGIVFVMRVLRNNHD